MNTRRHSLSIGSACLALAFADTMALSFYSGQPEAGLIVFPLLGAILVAAVAAKRMRFLTLGGSL
jgi:hypothetical protein